MSSYTKPLEVIFLGKGKFELSRDFEFHVGSYPSNDIVVAKKGFITDFASVPRILWSIFPPTGSYGKASVIHDYLIVENIRSRKECDLIFKEAMIVDKVPKFTIYVVYWSVKIAGIFINFIKSFKF